MNQKPLFKASGTGPFSTDAATLYRQHNWNIRNPNHAIESAVRTLAAREGIEEDEARKLLKTQPTYESEVLAYEIWTNDTPIYFASDVHATIGVATPFTKWRWANGIDKVLPAWQAAYILKYGVPSYLPESKRKEIAAIFQEPDDDADPNMHLRIAKHPDGWTLYTGVDLPGKSTSRIGKTVGRWKILQCLSASENTANNNKVVYKCQCVMCNAVKEIKYHSLRAMTCKGCEGRVTRGQKLPQPLVLYVSPKGDLLKPATYLDVPENAVGMVRITHTSEWTGVTPVNGATIKAELLLIPVQDHEMPVAAVLKPEQPEGEAAAQDPHSFTEPTPDDFVRLDDIPEM